MYNQPLTPPKFHPSQAVVCIDPSIPADTPSTSTYQLNMTTIYHVAALQQRQGKWFLRLVGIMEVVFEEIHFAPAELLPDAALAELLTDSFTPVLV